MVCTVKARSERREQWTVHTSVFRFPTSQGQRSEQERLFTTAITSARTGNNIFSSTLRNEHETSNEK